MTKEEATKLEANADQIMTAPWLDSLTKDQKIRIELLLEELMALGIRRQSISSIMKRVFEKEIRFAPHYSAILKKVNRTRQTSDTSSQLGEIRKTRREVPL